MRYPLGYGGESGSAVRACRGRLRGRLRERPRQRNRGVAAGDARLPQWRYAAHADAPAARITEDRGRLVRELAEQRQAAGLSQTEVAARMGTSQSAVARLETGTGDVRASTLERYAAAVGSQITWKVNRPGEGAGQ